MAHLTREEIDRCRDGNLNLFHCWRAARHLRRCAECRALLDASEADAAFAAEFKRGVEAFESFEMQLPESTLSGWSDSDD